MAITAIAATGKVPDFVVEAEEVEEGTTWGAAVAVLVLATAAVADETALVTEAAAETVKRVSRMCECAKGPVCSLGVERWTRFVRG